jgi:hypothetical protein
MLTKIGAVAVAAVILGVTAASAQSLIGDGLPAEAYGPYGTYTAPHVYAPAPYAYAPARRHLRAHWH